MQYLSIADSRAGAPSEPNKPPQRKRASVKPVKSTGDSKSDDGSSVSKPEEAPHV